MTDKEYLVEKLLSGIEAWNQWRRENPTQGRLDLTNVNLFGAILSGADLTNVDLTGAILAGVNLSKAKLYGASLKWTTLVYVEKRCLGDNDPNIPTRWCRLSYRFNYREPEPYVWWRADLKYADLEGVDLTEAELPLADLRGANLRRANLVGANLDKAEISGTIFEEATYSQATILPLLKEMQQQSLILVNPPQKPDKKEVLVDLDGLKDERKRTNVERVIRKYQGKFRDSLLDAFQGKCAITACDVECALDAAHIFPYRGDKTDYLWNGLLLRLDLHRLFDSYLLTIDPFSGQVYLEPSLMNSYEGVANTQVCFPEKPVSLNRKLALRWHNAQCSWLRSE
jgi:hypothetical protein